VQLLPALLRIPFRFDRARPLSLRRRTDRDRLALPNNRHSH